VIIDADRQAWDAARRRLTDRFGDVTRDEQWNARRCLEPETAVQAVALAIEHERPVDADDTRAGLLLVPLARDALYAYEHDLIRHARACRLTWEEIGRLLGIGDRRAAQRRYQRLTERLRQPHAATEGAEEAVT
jgi:hypothetical protein